MSGLNFNQEFVELLAENRGPLATEFFQFFSFMGEIEGYLLLVTILFVMVSKRIAVESSIVVLIAMIANHLLKIVIKNPRPFASDGTYLENWAVSNNNALELAAEYSTPSGHAMAASAFYGFLFIRIKNAYVRTLLAITILLLGSSRPIIGVHYAEDILIGWPLGIVIALIAARYVGPLLIGWGKLSIGFQLVLVAAFSSAVWFVTLAVDPRLMIEQPTAFVGYLGFLTGVMLAVPREEQYVGYEVDRNSIHRMVLRFFLMIGLLLGSLVLLDLIFGLIAPDGSPLSYDFRYIRYATVGFVGMFVSAWLFVRFGLTTQCVLSENK